jgi:hypothetical protein
VIVNIRFSEGGANLAKRKRKKGKIKKKGITEQKAK